MEFFDAITGLFLQFIDLVLHLDKHLAVLVQQYGPWIYAILFFIVFAETGFVVVPFLPGDSLLFVAGALAAIGDMALLPLMLSLSLAAVLGNSLNYVIGRWFGHRILAWNSRLLNRAALEKSGKVLTLPVCRFRNRRICAPWSGFPIRKSGSAC